MKRACFVIIILLAAGIPAQAQLYRSDRPAWIGHRGARALVDENTMESIKKALELGVDMIEFDIQQTKDGVYVLMHDDTVDRTTDGSGLVSDMTLEEFRGLRTDGGHVPPTLDEALDYLQEKNIPIILDIKCAPADDGEELYRIIRDRGLLDVTVFESTKPRFAGAIEKRHPEANTAIYPTNMPFMLIYAEKHDIDCVSYMWRFATPCEVWLAHRLDRDVVVWTVNSKRVIRWFYRLKVEGIMTDDPNFFLEYESTKRD